MADVSKGFTYTPGAEVTDTNLNALVDDATVTNIATADINDNAITTAKIAAGAVEAAQLDTDAVTTVKIQDDAITEDKLDNKALLLNEDTAPTTVENQGAIYTKNDGAQTEFYFKEESDGDEVQITDDGVLANTVGLTLDTIEDYGTSATTGTAKTQNNLKIVYGGISVNASSSQAITNLPFTSSSSYVVIPNYENSALDGQSATVVRNSGSQCTLYNQHSSTRVILWIAIGT